jgi:hypothetical protein
MLNLILLVFAFVMFVLAGLGVPWPPPQPWPWPYRLVAWGLACWVLTDILKSAPILLR